MNLSWIARCLRRRPPCKTTCDLARGRALTLHAAGGPMRMRVLHGLVWITGDSIVGDVVLHPDGEVCVPRGAAIVVEALKHAEIDWMSLPCQRPARREITSRGWWAMAWAPAARSSDSGRKPHVAPTANIPAARAVSMSVAVSPR